MRRNLPYIYATISSFLIATSLAVAAPLGVTGGGVGTSAINSGAGSTLGTSNTNTGTLPAPNGVGTNGINSGFDSGTTSLNNGTTTGISNGVNTGLNNNGFNTTPPSDLTVPGSGQSVNTPGSLPAAPGTTQQSGIAGGILPPNPNVSGAGNTLNLPPLGQTTTQPPTLVTPQMQGIPQAPGR